MSGIDPKLSEAIAFFEEMLRSLPGDRQSLEFLVVAYEQSGQEEKRRATLVQLAETLLAEKDFKNAQIVASYLKGFKELPEALTAAARVEQAVAVALLGDELLSPNATSLGEPPGEEEFVFAPAFQDEKLEIQSLMRSGSAAEMEVVWFWQEHALVSEEIAGSILRTLTEFPQGERPFLISALALLDELRPEMTERIMEQMQSASGLPLVPLEQFEIQPESRALLGELFIKIRGALPFAQLGEELLVALLNPLNKVLREEIKARTGRQCHFFCAHPRAWPQAEG